MRASPHARYEAPRVHHAPGRLGDGWPLTHVAWAQPGGKVPRVGYLWHAGNAKEEHPYFEALLEGFAKLGYVDGSNIKLEHRFPNETPERFKSMASELVSLNVDVLMGGATSSPYLRDATTKIPIVFMFIRDAVAMKLVKSIVRPGGNMAGLSNFGRDVAGKRLLLLRVMVPRLSRVALLMNPDQATTGVFVEAMQAAARELGLALRTFEVHKLDEIQRRSMPWRAPQCRQFRPSRAGCSTRHAPSLRNWQSSGGSRCCLFARNVRTWRTPLLCR